MPTDPSLARPQPAREPSYLPFPVKQLVSSTWGRLSSTSSSTDARSGGKPSSSRASSRSASPASGTDARRTRHAMPRQASSIAPYANLIDMYDSEEEAQKQEQRERQSRSEQQQQQQQQSRPQEQQSQQKRKPNFYDYDEEDDFDDFQPLPPPPPPAPVGRTYSRSPGPARPPFQPPPLTPLTLVGLEGAAGGGAAQILSRLIASEVRLLLPGRLELVDTWRLAFSLERDGASLSTLYDRCDEYRARRGGFVVAVRDAGGSIFGAYLSDAPAPSQGHYYGNGECFLWRSTVLSASFLSLPPPPSADTTHATRATTLGLPPAHLRQGHGGGADTPERIRFKAFPYSGENDYMIFCEAAFLSVGGGDGHYGLWLDAALERGVSGRSLTFGNEPLSDDGEKFEVIGVEVWYVGATT